MVCLLENHNRGKLSVFTDASEKAYGLYFYLKTTTDKSSVSSPRLLKRPMDGTSTWKPQQTRAQCLRRCFWKGLWMVLLLENHNRQELSVFTDASWKAYGLCVYLKTKTDKSSVSLPELLKRLMDGTSTWKPQQTRDQCLRRCFWKGLLMVRLLENHKRQELSVFGDVSKKRPIDGASTWTPQQTRAQCLHRCFWKGLWMVRLLENHKRKELSVFADVSEKAYRWCVYLKTTTDKSSVSSPMLLEKPMDGASTWKPQQTRAQCLHQCFWKSLWMVRLLENHNRQELSVFGDASEKAYGWYFYLKTKKDKSSVSSPMLLERPMDCASTWKPQQTRAQCLFRGFWKGLYMVCLLEIHNRQELSVFTDASEKAYGLYFYLKTTTDKSSVSSPMLLKRPIDGTSTWKPQKKSSVSSPMLLKRPMDGTSTWKPKQTRAQWIRRSFWKGLWMVRLLENHNRQELSVFTDASEKAYGWCVYLKTTKDKRSVSSAMFLKRPIDGASTWKPQQTKAQCLHRCFWKSLWMVRLLEHHNRQELSVFTDASWKAYGLCVYLKTTTDKSSVSSPRLLEKPMDGASTWKPQQTRAQCLRRCFWKGLWMVRLLENHKRQELSVFGDVSEKAYRWCVYLKTTTHKSSVSSPKLLKRPMDGMSTWKPQKTRAQCLCRCFWKGLWIVRLLENHNRQELSVFTDASGKAYGWCVYFKTTTDKSSVSSPMLLEKPMDCASTWKPQKTRAQCLCRGFWKGL